MRIVRVLMVLVVPVSMAVHEGPVGVVVLVPLGEMQPDSGSHQRRRETQLPGHRLPASGLAQPGDLSFAITRRFPADQ